MRYIHLCTVGSQRRSDKVDLCEINYLGSSLIDFCISTGKRPWLPPRRVYDVK